MTAQDTANSNALELPQKFDTSACEPVLKEFIARRSEPIVVDASKVEFVTSQAVALLLSAKRTWDEEGRGFELNQPSPDFQKDLKTLGISIDSFVSEA